jgi:hypothetical protein
MNAWAGWTTLLYQSLGKSYNKIFDFWCLMPLSAIKFDLSNYENMLLTYNMSFKWNLSMNFILHPHGMYNLLKWNFNEL